MRPSRAEGPGPGRIKFAEAESGKSWLRVRKGTGKGIKLRDLASSPTQDRRKLLIVLKTRNAHGFGKTLFKAVSVGSRERVPRPNCFHKPQLEDCGTPANGFEY